MGDVQVLHLVKSQCHASSLVTKVKLVERCFQEGVSVRFEMYECAPSDAPTPLPYFVKPDGTIVTDELELSKYLAAEGSPVLVPAEASAESDNLLSSEVDVNKTIKAACKSKTAEVWSEGVYRDIVDSALCCSVLIVPLMSSSSPNQRARLMSRGMPAETSSWLS